MAERVLEVDVYEFLQKIQLEQFFDKIDKVLHLTRLSHFDHVAESDLCDINMSKPEQRRLFDAIRKYKKDRKKASKTRFSLRKSKRKDSLLSSGCESTPVKQGPAKSCLISESSLRLLGELGDGAFGIVNKGEWTPNKGSKVSVAVKCLKFSHKDAFVKEQDNFMREASAMSDLDHPNVIRLYGVVLATPIKLVMELALLGSLQDRLGAEPEKFSISTLYDFVQQIASGMSYLESKRYVHRDLAARNILLASYDKVKIGDFGLMRLLPSEDDIYVMNPAGKIAVAWCAPECLKNRAFSHASDVWAFGITVIEIFSYGKQPWDGLTGSQILSIIDEPANGRPGKPDHCPDKLYSLLFEHCWDPNPKDRSKFSSIQQKLQEIVPEDVTLFFDLEKDMHTDALIAKSGDVVTVITWKSRLGTEFAKGQNKRTLEVGYFPVLQVTRSVIKRKHSTRPRIAKVKDISPPLDNSFSHCAHRGDGETPNWGSIMSEERQVLGKHHPLNLPTRLIPLNNADGECQIDGMSGEIDTCSLVSYDSCNYSSSLSLGPRSCADSGYYSNRDTLISQEYELMAGSHPIAIPGMSPPARSPGRYGPGIFIPGYYSRRTSGASLQFDAYHGQRCRVDSVELDFSVGQELRPPLPAKHAVLAHQSHTKLARIHGDIPYNSGSEITGDPYEDMRGLSRQMSEGPLISSSSESMYMNERDLKQAQPLGFVNMNYAIYDCPTRDEKSSCHKNGRCYSFPEMDLKRRNTNTKRRSVALEKEVPLYSLNESKSAPLLVREVDSSPNPENWEVKNADEAVSEEIYENIEIYNVPQTIMSDVPPPLPVKRKNSQRPLLGRRISESHDLGIYKNLQLTQEVLEEHYCCPRPEDVPSNFDSHLYAEISDKLLKELSLDEDVPSVGQDKQFKDSFEEISKDYADLDAICAKLLENADAENASEAEDVVCPEESKTLKKEDVLWRRFSTDKHRIQQHARRKSERGNVNDHPPNTRSEARRASEASTRSLSSSSLNSLQSLHTCASLVTTV